jgi:metal-responsive CopG/Arc/MetJ family transcriptional regulator
MVSPRITIRVPKSLEEKLNNRSRVLGQTPSELVRLALESYLGKRPEERSAYERAKAAGLIGYMRLAPADLSTSRRHFEGFGKRK